MLMPWGPLVLPYRHRSLPVFAATPNKPSPVYATYWRTPPAFVATMEEYPALAPPGTAVFHTTSPVFLFSVRRVASVPPGVLTTASPSTSGDSAYAHVPG